MKPPCIVHAALVATLVAAGTASAQNSVSIAGGVAIPMGDAAETLNAGYNASVALTAKPPLASVGVRLEGMFNSLGFKDAATGVNAQRIIAATANATLSDPATPLRSFFLIAGIGAYNTRLVGGSTQRGNNDVGFNVGLGMTITSAVGTFIEARYHHVPSEGGTMQFLPVTLGLKF
jgi:hypothetical protein